MDLRFGTGFRVEDLLNESQQCSRQTEHVTKSLAIQNAYVAEIEQPIGFMFKGQYQNLRRSHEVWAAVHGGDDAGVTKSEVERINQQELLGVEIILACTCFSWFNSV